MKCDSGAMMAKLLVLPILLVAILATPFLCTARSPLPNKLCCTRKQQTVGPYVAYVTSPHHIPNAAVIVGSDVYGFKAPLLRQFADKIASEGYFVVVPDFFNGDPYKDNTTSLAAWLTKHEPFDAAKGARKIIEILQKKGFLSIGALGFCWGGKVAVELAKGNSLKAIAVAHPALVTVDDIKQVTTPIAILAGELDTITPPSLVRRFIAVLKSKPELKSFVHIYPGVTHGWVIRYNVTDPQAVANAEKAQKVMLKWLGKFMHEQKMYNR